MPVEGEGGVFSFKPKSIEPEAVYEVRVRTVLDDRESEWSEEFEFSPTVFYPVYGESALTLLVRAGDILWMRRTPESHQ